MPASASVPAQHRTGFAPLGTPGSAPTSGAPSSGGSVDAGSHVWAVTFYNSFGESKPSASSGSQTTTSSNKTVALSAIPTAPAGSVITGRNVYRSKQGTTTPLYLVAAIADNTTTTYTDTTADASLGNQAPTVDTTTPYDNSDPVAISAGVSTTTNNGLTLPSGSISMDRNRTHVDFFVYATINSGTGSVTLQPMFANQRAGAQTVWYGGDTVTKSIPSSGVLAYVLRVEAAAQFVYLKVIALAGDGVTVSIDAAPVAIT